MEKAILRILLAGFILASSSAFSQDEAENSFFGNVQYHTTLLGLGDVTVTLDMVDGDYFATDLTDYAGYYEFYNVPAGEYVITFSTNQPAGGVDLEDVYLMDQFLDGEVEFTPIQELAADVNGNGIINYGDRMQIYNHVMGRGNPFAVGEWVFETDIVEIPGTGDREGELKLGSSSGDVNGSLVPDPKSSQIFLDNPVIHISNVASGPISFELASRNALGFTGMHLAFRIPENLRVISVASTVENITYYNNGGLLRITYLDGTRNGHVIPAGTSLVTILAEEINHSEEGSNYQLVLADESHCIDFNGKLISGLNLSMPSIIIDSRQEFSHKAYPNPFITQVTFEYQLPIDGNVNISVFDQYGRQITEISEGYQGAGIHQVKLDGNAFVPGIYHYSIRFTGDIEQIDNGIIIKSK